MAMADDIYSTDSQVKLKEIQLKGDSRPWNIAKFVLRATSLGCSVAMITITICIIFLGPTPEYVSYISSLVLSCFAALWNISEFLTMLIRRRWAGITPSAHVALDLIIWLLAGAYVGLAATFTMNYRYSTWIFSYGTGIARFNSYKLSLGLLGLGAIILMLHFTLFVRCCVELDRKKIEKRIRRIIMALGQRGEGAVAPGGPTQSHEMDRERESSQQVSVELRHMSSDVSRPDTVEREAMNVHKPIRINTAAVSRRPLPQSGLTTAVEQEHTEDFSVEANQKFIMPAALIRQMDSQKYQGMSPSEQSQKYANQDESWNKYTSSPMDPSPSISRSPL